MYIIFNRCLTTRRKTGISHDPKFPKYIIPVKNTFNVYSQHHIYLVLYTVSTQLFQCIQWLQGDYPIGYKFCFTFFFLTTNSSQQRVYFDARKLHYELQLHCMNKVYIPLLIWMERKRTATVLGLLSTFLTINHQFPDQFRQERNRLSWKKVGF